MPRDPNFRLPEGFEPPAGAVECPTGDGRHEVGTIERKKGGSIDVPRGAMTNFVEFPANAIKAEQARYRIGRPAGGYLVVRVGRASDDDEYEYGSEILEKAVTVQLSLNGCQVKPNRDLEVWKVEWKTGKKIAGPIAAERTGNAFVRFALKEFSAYIVVQI